MKRIKSVNGYIIYQATARDVTRHNVEEGYFYLYFSSDIRAYGLAYSYIEFEAGSLEEAEAIATGTNYAAAREYVEASTTAATYEEIEEIEKQLDNDMSLEEIEAAADEAAEAAETVRAEKIGNLFYVIVENDFDRDEHGPYLTIEAADRAARYYAENTGAEYQPVNN